MASRSGWNLWLWLAEGGCGWNLWVWLVGMVIRRYINFLILLIPTLVSALFWQQHPYFFVHFQNVFHFCSSYVIIFCTVYKSLQLLLYTPWLVCMLGMAE